MTEKFEENGQEVSNEIVSEPIPEAIDLQAQLSDDDAPQQESANPMNLESAIEDDNTFEQIIEDSDEENSDEEDSEEEIEDNLDPAEEIEVVNPLDLPMRENKYRRGTYEWVAEQNEIVTERLQQVGEEFERLRKIFRLDLALLHSSRKLLSDKQEELEKFITAKESLDSWIAERHGTYAWQLLEAVNAEKVKIANFEEEIKNWSYKSTEDLIQESHKNKKRFIRRIRWSFIGIIFSLTIGWVIQQIFNYFGIGWITSILALLGMTNPFSLITRAIGYGSLIAWIGSLFGYFRDYFTWKKKLAREVEEARFYLRAAKDLSVAKGRVHYLSKELEKYLHFLAEIIHKPWSVSDEWLNYEKSSIKPETIPTLLVVGKPSEAGVYQKVTKRTLESFASRNWHSIQFEQLLHSYEDLYDMKENTLKDRVDGDSKMREQLISDLTSTDLLQRIGNNLVLDLARELQNELLPNETGFHLNSIKPDALDGLDLTSSILGSAAESVDWHSFVTSILGPSTDWSPITFGVKGKIQGLQESKNLQSFALIPDRLQADTDKSVKAFVVNNSSKAGVEVVVRVDASGWMDPDKVSILDGKNVNKNTSIAESIIPTIEADPNVVTG